MNLDFFLTPAITSIQPTAVGGSKDEMGQCLMSLCSRKEPEQTNVGIFQRLRHFYLAWKTCWERPESARASKRSWQRVGSFAINSKKPNRTISTSFSERHLVSFRIKRLASTRALSGVSSKLPGLTNLPGLLSCIQWMTSVNSLTGSGWQPSMKFRGLS